MIKKESTNTIVSNTSRPCTVHQTLSYYQAIKCHKAKMPITFSMAFNLPTFLMPITEALKRRVRDFELYICIIFCKHLCNGWM
uniref:Uncharacterized protein n=1 Tax=Rhizophora mucronata TaxID=61149 RepID=A0A2P2PNH5_RHIMU